MGRPQLRFVVLPSLPEDLAVDVASRLRRTAATAGVEVAWIEAPLDGEFSLVCQHRTDAGLDRRSPIRRPSPQVRSASESKDLP